MAYFTEFYDANENHVGTRRLRALHRDDAAREASTLLKAATTATQAIVMFNHKSETLQVFVIDAAMGLTYGTDYAVVQSIEAGPDETPAWMQGHPVELD